jgi:hypothetical protein
MRSLRYIFFPHKQAAGKADVMLRDCFVFYLFFPANVLATINLNVLKIYPFA